MTFSQSWICPSVSQQHYRTTNNIAEVSGQKVCFQQTVPEHRSQPACPGQADAPGAQGQGSSKDTEYKAAEHSNSWSELLGKRGKAPSEVQLTCLL